MKPALAIALVCILAIALWGCASSAKENEDKSKNFAALYSTNCSGCHGANGKLGPARMLNSPVYLAILPKEELRNVIANGRPGTAMPPFAQSQGGQLSDQQISTLVDGMEKNWAKPVKFGSVTPPPYQEEGNPGDSKVGAALFTNNCAGCHHQHGNPGPVNTPVYLSLTSNQYLRSMILAGRTDLGMPDWRILHGGKPFSGQDVSDIVAYLASLRPQGAMSGAVENSSGPTSGSAGHSASGGVGSAEKHTNNPRPQQ